jgi:hypothetical protein
MMHALLLQANHLLQGKQEWGDFHQAMVALPCLANPLPHEAGLVPAGLVMGASCKASQTAQWQLVAEQCDRLRCLLGAAAADAIARQGYGWCVSLPSKEVLVGAMLACHRAGEYAAVLELYEAAKHSHSEVLQREEALLEVALVAAWQLGPEDTALGVGESHYT